MVTDQILMYFTVPDGRRDFQRAAVREVRVGAHRARRLPHDGRRALHGRDPAGAAAGGQRSMDHGCVIDAWLYGCKRTKVDFFRQSNGAQTTVFTLLCKSIFNRL